jgi:hypothetical protein
MTFPVLSANGPTGYNLTRSLRFRSSASAYLNRTPASATNQKTWTWSGWVKLGSIGNPVNIFGTRYTATAPSSTLIRFANNNIDIVQYTTGSVVWNLVYTPVYRDFSAWYHVVVAIDTTQATSTNRLKLYINGVQVTATTTASYPAQNNDTYVNSTNNHAIGTLLYGDGSITPIQGLDGYLAEVNFIDGQALTPSSFGSTNSATGVWQPAKYTGTYGTNGFYLPFTNITSTTTLGYDSSGNGNNWTANNISLTAGATYDSMTDVPTLTSATAANYPVLNPLDKLSAVTAPSNGNLRYTTANTFGLMRGTIGATSGKWYYETTITAVPSGGSMYIGVKDSLNTSMDSSNGLGSNSGTTNEFGYAQSGYQQNNGTATNIGTTLGAGDVLMVAYDLNGGYIWWGKNGTWISSGNPATGANPMFSTLTSSNGYSPSTGYNSSYTDGVADFNFGQRPFSYTPPSGFVALNTYNLPASTVPNGAAFMAATLYTGTGASLTVANTVGSASFQPDLVWIKSRSAATAHKLTDVVRGVTKGLISNTTGAETTDTQGLTAFGSTGFTVGTDTNYNTSAATYVAWQWKGGGTAVSNTNGSITSSVSANTTSGCSVVTYTGNSTANATVGHGLGVTPQFFVVKIRSSTSEWLAYHVSTGKDGFMQLQATDAFASSANYWGTTGPTSSTIQLNGGGGVNGSGFTYVAYCFAAIKGFSAFGSYTGNGSTDGPFVYTGFRPRWIMMKRTDSTSQWVMYDSSRNLYNVTDSGLFPNLSAAEETGNSAEQFDLLSNGFKMRSNGRVNVSAGTFIYAAFAENPFQNALAR